MRIGFVAWNKFQIAQMQNIARYLDAHVTLIYQTDRPAPDKGIVRFPPSWCSVLAMARTDMKNIDGLFEAIITQTALPEASKFNNTKIIALQYSMTKEKHQYGAWHLLADARLVYGPYSHGILSYYGNTFMVGNPRFDDVLNGSASPEIIQNIRSMLDPAKKTVLYVPTWGKLSSLDAITPFLGALSSRYNFIISGHHNTMLREAIRADLVRANQPTSSSVDTTPYYHLIADAVVSDYSGALFDALLVKKPVVMFRPDHEKKIGVENLTLESAEIQFAHHMGPIATNGIELLEKIDGALNSKEFHDHNRQLREMCFSNPGSAGEAARDAILEIISQDTDRPKALSWVRDHLSKLAKTIPASPATKTTKSKK